MADETKADGPTRYHVDDLRENSAALLGMSRPAVDGALYGQTRKTYTIDEMKKLIDKFLTREHD